MPVKKKKSISHQTNMKELSPIEYTKATDQLILRSSIAGSAAGPDPTA